MTKRVPVDRPVEGAPGAPALHRPDDPFPPYRFVPGVTPHPFKQQGGYAYGETPPVPAYLERDSWHADVAYLRGLDFFNRGWWWEAHEVWEGLWHVVEGRDTARHALLKALIQLSAAALNRERGHDGPAERLLESALAGIARVRNEVGRRCCGLDLDRVAEDARAALAAPAERIDGFYLHVTPPEAAAGSASDATDALSPGTAATPAATSRVLFLCTHNSARSQMAEGLLRHFGGDRFDAHSAGTERTHVRPDAIAAMAEIGVDISEQRSKTLERYVDQPFDVVITVCDSAHESCPVFTRAERRLHWSFPDPSRVEGDEPERLAAYREVRDAIAARIRAELLDEPR